MEDEARFLTALMRGELLPAVSVSAAGARVAVLLTNRRSAGSDARGDDAVNDLFCAIGGG